jgi:hypothetical protein
MTTSILRIELRQIYDMFLRLIIIGEIILVMSACAIKLILLAGGIELVVHIFHSLDIFRWEKIGMFALAASALALAKERNFWRNEFRICPLWLKCAGIFFMVIGLLLGIVQANVQGGDFVRTQIELECDGALFLASVGIWIPYATLTNNDYREGARKKMKVAIAAFFIVTITGMAIF